MDPVAVTALILSIISILLWAFTFLFPVQLRNLVGAISKPNPVENKQKDEERDSALPANVKQDTPVTSESQPERESQFMSETQKFSQMVQKNLEMLNTRVGVKFSVKPLSQDYHFEKKKGPNFIDSMDVTEEENDRMLSDESDGKS